MRPAAASTASRALVIALLVLCQIPIASAQDAYRVRDLRPGPNSSTPGGPFEVSNGLLYFSANTGTDGSIIVDLWQSDGTALGTRIAMDSVGSQNPKFLTDVDGELYYVATESNTGRELWRLVGGNPQRVTDIRSGTLSSNPEGIVNVNGTVYFTAISDTFGRELYRTDGVGAVQVVDLTPGENGTEFSTNTTVPNFVALGDQLLFVADDGVNGRELWRTQGTAATTVRLTDFAPGSESTLSYRIDPDAGDRVENLLTVGDQAFFAGVIASGNRFLGVTDGTVAGTRVLREFESSEPDDFAELNGELIFSAGELWKSDGTIAGTMELADINLVGPSFPTFLTTVGNFTFFTVLGENGDEFWRTDGTSAGTTRLAPVGTGKPIGLDGVAYFSAADNDFGQELWRSNGLPNGTLGLTDINPGPGSAVFNQLGAVNGRVFMAADDGVSGEELWAIQVGEVTETDSAANFELSGSTGDPINTFTGELFESPAPDLDLGGPLPLTFSRYYASGLSADGIVGSLGRNWRHNYEWTLIRSPGTAEIITPFGRRLQFLDENGSWILVGVSLDQPWQLVTEGTGLVLGDPATQLLYVFDADDRLAQIQDISGNTLTLSYTGAGLLTSVADGLGRSLTFTQQPSGLLTQVEDDNSRVVAFGHTGEDLTTLTDVRGGQTLYSYTGAGLLTSTELPEGNVRFRQTWDDQQRVISQSDDDGNTTTLTYDGAQTRIVDPLLNEQVHEHSGAGQLTGITDAEGETTGYVSDGDGRRAGVVDRLGGTSSFQYSPDSGLLEQLTRADGQSITYEQADYVVRGITFRNYTSITYPDGTSIAFGRDGAGRLTSLTDQAGGVWTFSRNAAGQLLSSTNPLGGTTTQTFNPDGTLATRTDPAGNATSFSYDALRRLTGITYPGGDSVTLTRNDADQITAVTDPRGNTTSLSYDANGRLTGFTDRAGEPRSYGYDSSGRLTSVQRPGGHVVSLGYDSRGLLTTLQDNLGELMSMDYNALGQLSGISDNGANRTSFSYDEEGGLTEIQDSDNAQARIGLNATGGLSSLATGSNAPTSVSFDSNARPIEQQLPSGRSVSRTLDAQGRENQVQVGPLQTSRNVDALGRVTSVTNAAGTSATAQYDNQGRLTSSTDRLGQTTSYSYDSRSRVSGATFPGGAGSVSYTYDANGNLTRALYSDGTDISATFDAEDRLVSGSGITLAYDGNGEIVQSNGLQMTRRADGRLLTVAYPSGMTVSYTYNARGLLDTVSDSMGNSASFSYTPAGRRSAITRSNGVTTSYDYDTSGRLTRLRVFSSGSQKGQNESAKGGFGLIDRRLRYDPDGRLAEVSGQEPLAPDFAALPDLDFSFNAAGQISSKLFNPLGQVTEADGTQYSWDIAGRLSQISDAAQTIDLGYDATNRMVSMSLNGQQNGFDWNYATGRPSLAVQSVDGQDWFNWTSTPEGEPLWRSNTDESGVWFTHFDELGNAVLATNENGTAGSEAKFDAFGKLLAGTPLWPLGPRALQGALSLTGDIYSDAPGEYIHSGARTRIKPRAGGDFDPTDQNPYSIGRAGSPVPDIAIEITIPSTLAEVAQREMQLAGNTIQRFNVDFLGGLNLLGGSGLKLKGNFGLADNPFLNSFKQDSEVCTPNRRASIAKEIRRLEEQDQDVARVPSNPFFGGLGFFPIPSPTNQDSPLTFFPEGSFYLLFFDLEAFIRLFNRSIETLRQQAPLDESDNGPGVPPSIVPGLGPIVIIC